MTNNVRPRVQQFIIFGGVLFGEDNIPLHFGVYDGELIIRGAEVISATPSKDKAGREIRFTLPFGGTVKLSDDNGERGFTANRNETPMIVKATRMMIVG